MSAQARRPAVPTAPVSGVVRVAGRPEAAEPVLGRLGERLTVVNVLTGRVTRVTVKGQRRGCLVVLFPHNAGEGLFRPLTGDGAGDVPLWQVVVGGDVQAAVQRGQERLRGPTAVGAGTLTYDNRTQPLADWALEFGLTPNCLYQRLANGWPLDECLHGRRRA